MVTIAVDAMGGDFAPEAEVKGALECLADPRCDFAIALYGDAERIAPYLAGRADDGRLAVVHTTEIIDMHDSAMSALKTKKDSSMGRALEAHKAGDAQGFISAGNTGAVMAASTLILGRVPGVARPTIGTFMPTVRGWTLLVDAGANVDCKAHHLVQFAMMGSIYTELMRGVDRPTVGLLNVGEEDSKGGEVPVAAHRMLKEAPINFHGNVEGGDIFKGTVDVVVCDGFTGNVILKVAESVPGFLKATFRRVAEKSLLDKLRIGFAAGALRTAMKDWDYQDYGGVPLLGVNGVSIIGHGRSTPRAIKNMILKAKETIDRGVTGRIAQAMAAHTAPGS